MKILIFNWFWFFTPRQSTWVARTCRMHASNLHQPFPKPGSGVASHVRRAWHEGAGGVNVTNYGSTNAAVSLLSAKVVSCRYPNRLGWLWADGLGENGSNRRMHPVCMWGGARWRETGPWWRLKCWLKPAQLWNGFEFLHEVKCYVHTGRRPNALYGCQMPQDARFRRSACD